MRKVGDEEAKRQSTVGLSESKEVAFKSQEHLSLRIVHKQIQIHNQKIKKTQVFNAITH